jgi:hypothetical protein
MIDSATGLIDINFRDQQLMLKHDKPLGETCDQDLHFSKVSASEPNISLASLTA